MRWVMSLIVLALFTGCQTVPKQQPKADTMSDLTSYAQGLTNKPITEDQLKNIAAQVSKDPQAQSALKSINSAFSPEHTVKYCPEDGTRYSAKLEWVP